MTLFLVSSVLLIAGVIAGLIQYFVDFKGLPIHGSSTEKSSFAVAEADFWTRLLNFLRRHWQLVGYLVIGIGGAALVPVLSELVTLKGIDGPFDCLGKQGCDISNWTLLILLGYGIISGYSAVRLLRSIGSLLINSLSENFLKQQKSLDEATAKIKELETKVETLQKVQVPQASFVPDRALAGTSASVSDYFNNAQNEVDKTGYYSEVDLNGTQDLFGTLEKLLTTTHRNKLPYKPSAYLYPLVDLHPDNLLRSVYHPETIFDPKALIAMDGQIDFLREMKREQFDCLEMSKAEFELQVRRELPYNCEHVVPQGWFDHDAPMVGDLHHLFACELVCNGFRQDYPYHDFQDYGTDNFDKPRCGRVESTTGSNQQKFEPIENKGAVARAVLYFVVRYPGAIGNKYKPEDIGMLVRWHQNNPVTLYELHRNQCIYNLQGNRNPFIDFPDLAAKVDFSTTFDAVARTTFSTAKTASHDEAAAIEFGLAPVDHFQDCPVNPSLQWDVWRVAESLRKLLGQINTAAPARKKASDGTIGDTSHRNRNSDHNPWIWDENTRKGVVSALDVTHDPAGKCDCNILVASLVTNKDPRIKYIIWNKRIVNSSPIGGTNAWVWRSYSGSNPHDKHVHISVKCPKSDYDDNGDWSFELS